MTDNLSSKMEQAYQNMTPPERQRFDASVNQNLMETIDRTAREARAGIQSAGLQQAVEEYKTAMYANRGNRQALKNIKDNARANGVPVDQVIFT